MALLFTTRPKLAVDVEQPASRNASCSECKIHAGKTLTHCCVPASATRPYEPGEAILVVLDEITSQDDARGATAVGPQGAVIRRLLSDATDRPVVYTAAQRCAYVVDKKGVDKCRPYLVDTIKSVKPYRIIVFGADAARSVFGDTVPVYDAIGGYGFTGDGTVIHIMPAAWLIASNKLWQKQTAVELVGALNSTPTQKYLDSTVYHIDAAHKAEMMADDLYNEPVTFDCEYFGRPYTREFKVTLLALSKHGSNTVYQIDWQALEDDDVVAAVRRVMECNSPKIGQNIKVDVNALFCNFGIVPAGPYYDTRLVRKLLRSDAGATLDALSYMVGMGGYKGEFDKELADTIKRLRKEQKTTGKVVSPWGYSFPLPDGADAKAYAYAFTDTAKTSIYNARDVVATDLEAARQIEALQDDQPIARVFTLVVQPATEALCQVERWGAPVDRNRVLMLRDKLNREVDAATRTLRSYGLDNPNSHVQVKRVLYDDLKLRYRGMREQGSDVHALKKLKQDTEHPVVDALMNFRKVDKLRGTYADGILDAICDDGRIHPDLKLDGAETGRMSCVNPNLQNIPRAKSELGKQVRDLFCAGPGKVLIEFDYSQLELRIAAMMSRDRAMIEIFKSGVDYHFRTAQFIAPIVWGKHPDDITKDGPERDAAKQINFSLLYGKSIKSLAEDTGLKEHVVERIKQAIFGAFPSLAKWITARERETTATGLAWTMLDGLPGRRRIMYQIAGSDSESASSALRSSYNTPVQGTGSDYCTRSIVACVNWIRNERVKAKLCLAVHDSLLFEAHESAMPQLIERVPLIMEGWYSAGVPLIVDAKAGPSWGSMKGVELEHKST